MKYNLFNCFLLDIGEYQITDIVFGFKENIVDKFENCPNYLFSNLK